MVQFQKLMLAMLKYSCKNECYTSVVVVRKSGCDTPRMLQFRNVVERQTRLGLPRSRFQEAYVEVPRYERVEVQKQVAKPSVKKARFASAWTGIAEVPKGPDRLAPYWFDLFRNHVD